jgi:hypothetical protein
MANKYDLYIQGKDPSEVNSLKVFTRAFSRSVGIRGVQKLVVQWVKRFMTPKGTDPTNLDDGTDFPNLIGSNIVSETDLRDVTMLAIEECNEQIKTVQQVTQPDEDETLLTAVLSDFKSWGDDGFEAYITISNLQNEEAEVVLPGLATRS